MQRKIAVLTGIVLGVATPMIHAAQKDKGGGATYPDRPVRFIVPFAPGGPSDILSRMLAQKLGENTGHTFVVDNRGAVGGIVGAEVGAKAAPDGYTVTLTANSLLTINPHVYKKLPYDPIRDFQPITQLTEGGNVVVVHPSVKATNIKEFIALAKANPGKFAHATTGTGNVLGIGHFKVRAGIDMLAVPYKGTGQAVIDLVGGQVQFFFMNPLVALGNVKGGKLRALAVTSLKRNPALPDVPTVDESGLPGFKNITWHSVQVPMGTPKPIVTRLNTELVKIVNQKDVSDRFLEQGLTPVGNQPTDVTKLIREESAETAKLVKQIGLEPQ
jgi:tripartite-type tricarboxylate transporter receptor subunit TctC